MSHVTDVILSFSCNEVDEDEGESYPILDEITKFLKENYPHEFQPLKDVTNAGGNKYMQQNVYAGAFNKLNIETFVSAVFSLNWVEPQNVQLFIKDEDEDRFTVYEQGSSGAK